MSRCNHRVDLIIDGKRMTIEGKQVELMVDKVPVYELQWFDLEKILEEGKQSPETLESFNVRYLLKAVKALFGHPDRYKIVLRLKNSPKSFTEIQKQLEFKPPTLDYHLKKLVNGMIVGKNEKGNYTLTLIGETLLDYFTEYLHKLRKVQSVIIDS